MTWLIADIGGTNARFALCDRVSEPGDYFALQTLPTGDYPHYEDAVRDYFRQQQRAPVHRMMLALPCPVESEPIQLTNAGWNLKRQSIAEAFALQELQIVNDFYAQAMALPHLGNKGQTLLNPDSCVALPTGNRVVLGPGTGLGVAALVAHNGMHIPVTGEGGHVTLAAHSDYEAELLKVARSNMGHVSAEKLISGIGLSALEACICEVAGESSTERDSRAIVQAACQGDQRALETVHQMLQFLATVAADLALSFSALGGVYLSGGILPRLQSVLNWSVFHQRFLAKGRFASYLKPIPIYLVHHQQPGLLGLTAMIRDAEQT